MATQQMHSIIDIINIYPLPYLAPWKLWPVWFSVDTGWYSFPLEYDLVPRGQNRGACRRHAGNVLHSHTKS